MLGASNVLATGKAAMPAAVHVDQTARPQVADEEVGILYSLLRQFEELGETAVLLNTSFNGPGEPLVDSATDCIRAFDRIPIDFLALEHLLLERC
jgi:carbamoyltransferase